MSDPKALDLDALRRLAAEATPGPWKAVLYTTTEPLGLWQVETATAVQSVAQVTGFSDTPGTRQDAAFIASARSAVPALIDELESARARAATLTAQLEAVTLERDGLLADVDAMAETQKAIRARASAAETERDEARDELERARMALPDPPLAAGIEPLDAGVRRLRSRAVVAERERDESESRAARVTAAIHANDLGRDCPSEMDLTADGIDFGSWERGFQAALDSIRARAALAATTEETP